MNIKERLTNNSKKVNSCWIWTGYRNKKYGNMSYKNRPTPAHRVSYEIYKGPIGKDLTVDHLCKNTLCINPDHLEAVTVYENLRRASASKTHCKHGHEFNKSNTLVYKRIRRNKFENTRECKKCHLRREQKRRLRIGMKRKPTTPSYK